MGLNLALSCFGDDFSKACGIFMTGKRKVIYHILYPVVNSDQSIALKCEETSEFVSLSGKVALSKRDIDKRRLDSQPTRLVGISVQS